MSVLRKKGEKGFTLIEMLIVVAIIAIIAGIATVSVSTTLKKQRVEAAAYQFQSFVESASVHARERSRGVFVWVHRDADPTGTGFWWYCYLIEDTNRNDILEYVVTNPNGEPPGVAAANPDTFIPTQKVTFPDDISIAPATPIGVGPQWPGPNNWPALGADFVLLCDPRALPFNPTLATPVQINAPLAISLTHREMVAGDLHPQIRYDIFISPLWHTRLDTVMY